MASIWEWIRIRSFWIECTSSRRPRPLLHFIDEKAKQIPLNISVLLVMRNTNRWRRAHQTRRASRANVEPSIEPPTKHVEPVEPLDSKEKLIIFLFKSTGSTGSTCFVGGSILGSTLASQALRVLWAHRYTHLIPNANNTEADESGCTWHFDIRESTHLVGKDAATTQGGQQ